MLCYANLCAWSAVSRCEVCKVLEEALAEMPGGPGVGSLWDWCPMVVGSAKGSAWVWKGGKARSN